MKTQREIKTDKNRIMLTGEGAKAFRKMMKEANMHDPNKVAVKIATRLENPSINLSL